MSATVTGLPANAEAYLAALRAELADLAPEERDDLLSEVEPSLLEAAGEDDSPIAARLGAPADFAADLRASAGLPPRSRADAARPGALARLRASRVARRALRLAGELAPLWWLARAYVVVAVLALAFDVRWSVQRPELPVVGSAEGTGLALLAALAGSVALGLAARRGSRRLRTASIALNVVLAIAAVAVYGDIRDRDEQANFNDAVTIVSPWPAELAFAGEPVRNLYAYDRAGRLLDDVRLYDQLGRPVDVRPGDKDRRRRPVRTRDGRAVFNAFPIRYFEKGTRRVADPAAAPSVKAPPLVTPPLRAGDGRR